MQTFGLIGRTLEHSFSKAYFTGKFGELGLSACYNNYECSDIHEIKTLLANTTCTGFNVTIPYKTDIINLLDGLDDSAQRIGAVNTIVKEDGQWIGYNTDVYGFKQMIKPFFESHHQRAIIIGTGGASKAVEFVLEELGANVIFISRNPSASNQFSYSDINELMLKNCPIIVNTTPIGTYPNVNEVVDIPYQFIGPRNLVVDLVYNPSKTQFMVKALQQGATAINGLTMLHQQAEKAWSIWQRSI